MKPALGLLVFENIPFPQRGTLLLEKLPLKSIELLCYTERELKQRARELEIVAQALTEERQAPVLAPIALPAGGRGVATVNLTRGCAHSSIIRGGPEKPDIIKKLKTIKNLWFW